MKECPSCHYKNSDTAKFCSECGHKFVDQKVIRNQNSEKIPLKMRFEEGKVEYVNQETESGILVVIPENLSSGIRLTMVSNKGYVLYVHDTLVKSSDDFFIKNGVLYICSVPGYNYYDSDYCNVDWIKIDKKGKSSRIRAEQLPIKDSFDYSIRATMFKQSHPNCYVHELGTIDGKHIFSALPLTDNQWVDYYHESSTIYDEDFNRIMSVRAGFEPVRLYKSWYLLVKECRTQRYGIIDKNQNIVIPCEYDLEIHELSDGVFNVITVGIDKTVYVAKERKWYNSSDYQLFEYYLLKKKEDGLYQLINTKSDNVLIEQMDFTGTGWSWPDMGFVEFGLWDHERYYEILCHGDSLIKRDDCEFVTTFKDSHDFISEGRIITHLLEGEVLDGPVIMFRIRDYSGKIIKELAPSYQFRRGYKYGKALFIKETSRCRRVGYVDLSGKVTLLPFEIPLKRGFDEDEWVEIIDVDCEFVSRDSILIKNDYDQYLIDVNGSILDDGDNYINVLADDLLTINRTYGSKYMGTLCNGRGDVLYRYEDANAQLEVIQ